MIGSSLSDNPELDRPAIPSTGYLPAAVGDGPETVVNPELRKRQEAVLPRTARPFDTDLGRRLFPADHSSVNIENPPSPAGCELGHFRIEELIGRGGMGAVFRAIDERLDRVVALKVLAPNYSRDGSTVERFRNEARAAARLDHENIARVFFTDEADGVHFIAHEFVTGTNLRDLIRERGRLSFNEAVNYTLQMASALRHTSSAGVVHRDIKPSNIIITPSGRAKLVDLGLARKEYSEAAPELTIAGTTLGTFDYISPEQAKDPRDVDVRSDIYSLGCTLYHMLTGEPPYPEGTFFKRLLDRQDKAPPNPALKAPGIPPGLAAIIQRMMAAEPRMRYPSAESLTTDLLQIAGEIGLRGVHPEGLVWTHTSQIKEGSFWERNFSLIATAAALIMIVFAIERFSQIDPSTDNNARRTTGTQSSVANSKTPLTGRGPGGIAKSGTGKSEPAAKSAAKETRIKQPNKITVPSTAANPDAKSWVGAINGASGLLAQSTLNATPAGGSGNSNQTSTASKPPGTGTGNGKTSPSTVAADSKKPFTVLTNDGERPLSYPTLEAACAAAANGQIVVLNFNGVRTNESGDAIDDLPLRIVNKSITIRAGENFRPVIRFAAAENSKPRMIVVSNGRLNVINTGFELNVVDRPERGNGDRWVLFSLQGADRLDLRGVHTTIENSNGQTAAVIEISQRTGPSMAKNMSMKKNGNSQPERFEITIADSFFRCDANLVTVNHPRPGAMEIRNSAVVVEQSLLLCEQMAMAAPDSATIDLKLIHTTTVSHQATLKIQTGFLPESVMPIRVMTAKDNLFAAKSTQPFIAMTGNSTGNDFLQMLKWDGEKNFYNRFKSLWSIRPNDRIELPQAMTFRNWQDHWRNDHEVTPRDGEVAWKSNWAGKSASSFSLKDLEIDSTAETASTLAATDGPTVGVDLSGVANPDMPKTNETISP